MHNVGNIGIFCTTSNANKLETVKSQISFNVNLHFSWCFELKSKSLFPLSNSLSNFQAIQKRQHCQLCVLRENSTELLRMCFRRNISVT